MGVVVAGSSNGGLVLISCWLLLAGLCSGAGLGAFFVFGDSLVDAGNNNYIATLSRADFPPNGIDFLPYRLPTGRFSNGRTVTDILGRKLGLGSFAPPYMSPATTGEAILRGVNYASGAGGILNETGKLFGERINLDAQIDNFASTRQQLITALGEAGAARLLRRSLFSVTMGSNDFINNYLTPSSLLPGEIPSAESPDSFADRMIKQYKRQLTRLYDLGARKVVVTNVGPIGCVPHERELALQGTSSDGCSELPNRLAAAFNSKLMALLVQLNGKFRGATIVYADVFGIVSDVIRNPGDYGFDVADSACCQLAGRFGGLLPCGPASRVCPDRTKYVFWDSFHPSYAANAVIAGRLLDGNATDVSPISVRQLAQLA